MWKLHRANTGIPEQWVFRVREAPACALKRGETKGTWQASLLKTCGKHCVVMELGHMTLEQAQRDCECELRCMGWSWGTARESSDATASG